MIQALVEQYNTSSLKDGTTRRKQWGADFIESKHGDVYWTVTGVLQAMGDLTDYWNALQAPLLTAGAAGRSPKGNRKMTEQKVTELYLRWSGLTLHQLEIAPETIQAEFNGFKAGLQFGRNEGLVEAIEAVRDCGSCDTWEITNDIKNLVDIDPGGVLEREVEGMTREQVRQYLADKGFNLEQHHEALRKLIERVEQNIKDEVEDDH